MARLFLLNHPATEPGYHKRILGSVNILPWTKHIHRRKFIKRDGLYLEKEKLISSTLCFWGEYEPYSEATIISKTTPKAIHYNLLPVRSLPPMPNGALNTDPYVFGCFRNICCRRGATKYQPGDILVFGYFRTDSIFEFEAVVVVEKLVPCLLVPANDQYRLASVVPLKNAPESFVDGVVYSPKLKSKYYSFVPCLPNCNASQTIEFTKPILDTIALFGKRAKKGAWGYVFANVPLNNVAQKQRYWDEIRKAVKNAGLKEGVCVGKIDNEIIF